MILKANTAYNIGFTINDATGAACDADSLPTASVYSNATEIVASANTTVARITGEDGCYTATFTTPETVISGQIVKLLIKATVDEVACKAFKNLGVFGETVDELNDIDGSSVTVTTNSDKSGYSLSVTPPTAAEIRAEVDSNSNQLSAIKAKTETIPASPAAVGSAMTLTAAYDAAKTAASTTDVSSAASSINSNIDANETKIDTLGGNIDTIGNLVYGIAAELDTTPLSTLADKTTIDAIYNLIKAYADGDVAAIKVAVDSLVTRLTSARAGYIDKLNVAGVLANTDNADSFKADLSELDLSGLSVTVDTAAIVTALKASTGYTEGGTWTFADIVKILTAVAFGNCKDKSGSTGTYQLLDAEDGTTVISETTLATSTPYVTTIKS